jgi:hypothetical protein
MVAYPDSEETLAAAVCFFKARSLSRGELLCLARVVLAWLLLDSSAHDRVGPAGVACSGVPERLPLYSFLTLFLLRLYAVGFARA